MADHNVCVSIWKWFFSLQTYIYNTCICLEESLILFHFEPVIADNLTVDLGTGTISEFHHNLKRTKSVKELY